MNAANEPTSSSSHDSIPRRQFLQRSAGAAGALAFVPDLSRRRRKFGKAPVKLAVVGVGRHGRTILAELGKLNGGQVVAVCDLDPNRLRSAKRRAKGAEAFEDFDSLLQKQTDVEAVIVATPTQAHREACEKALAAGKHVFCEAPLVSTLADGQALVQAARATDKVFAVGLQGRTNPVYRLARSFARSGSLQTVVDLRGQWNKKTSWRVATSNPAMEKAHNWRLDPAISIGLAGEVASHQIDTVSWFLNQYPNRVWGKGTVRLHEDGRQVADTIRLVLDFPNGASMEYQASLCSSYEGSYELLRGSNATIKLADTFGWMFKEADSATQGWEVYASRERFHNDEGITLIADATQLASQGKLKEGIGLPHLPLHYALEDFLEAIEKGRKPKVSAEAGLRAAVIGILANQAVLSGEAQAITENNYQGKA